jgi:hypothetical protein
MTEWEEQRAMEFLYLWGRKTHITPGIGGTPYGGLWEHTLSVMADAHEMGLINVHPIGNLRAFTPTALGRAILALYAGDNS